MYYIKQTTLPFRLSILLWTIISATQGFVVKPVLPTARIKKASLTLRHRLHRPFRDNQLNTYEYANGRKPCDSKLHSQSSSSSVPNSNEDEKTSSNNNPKKINQSQQQQQTITRKNDTPPAPHDHAHFLESKVSSSTSTNIQTSPSQSSSSPNQSKQKQLDKNQILYEEAQKLREKAKQLYQEATVEEEKLLIAKTIQKKEWNAKLDDLIDELNLLKHQFDDHDVQDAQNISTTIRENNEIPFNQVIEFIHKKGLSTTKLINLVERIHEREMNAKRKFMDGINPVNSDAASKSNIIQEKTSLSSFNIGDMTMSKEYNQNELLLLHGLIDCIINAQTIIDGEDSKLSSSPSSRIIARNKELKRVEDALYQRQLANKINQGLLSNKEKPDEKDSSLSNDDSKSMYLMQDYMSKTLGDGDSDELKGQNVTIKIDGKRITASKFNITNLLADIADTPLWVPSSLLPYVIIAQEKLDHYDLKKIKSDVLMGSQFQCTSWDSCRFAAIYRGDLLDKNRASSVNLLSGVNKKLSISSSITTVASNNNVITEAEESLSSRVFHDIQNRLIQVGLSDKIQLFMMEDPLWRPGQDSRQLEPQPVIIAVSSKVLPDQGTNRGKAAILLTVSYFN